MRSSKLLALGVGLLASPSVFGWTLNYNPPRKVSGSTMELRINYQDCPATFDAVVDRAIAIWNSVPTSYLKLEKMGPTGTKSTQVVAGTHEDFAIVCDRAYAANTGSQADLTLAVATSSTGEGGFIVRGGVVVNMETTLYSDSSVDIQAQVLAHEIGHVFGLGHSSDPLAIMYYEVRPSGAKPTIGQDDIDGMTYLYPRNEAFGEDQGGLFGCASLSGRDHGDSGGSATGALSLFGFFAMLWAFCQGIKRTRVS